MELFGYVCSPLCKGKAETRGMHIPVYAGQKSVVEAAYWNKLGWLAWALTALVVAALGVWGWYEFYASRPKTIFAVRFDEKVYSGQSAFAGTNQIVFLHGDTLARYDLKLNKEIWSRHLVDKKAIEKAVDEELKAMQAAVIKAQQEDPDRIPKIPSKERLQHEMERELAAELDLRVRGQNIWVRSADKLVRYDWNTGAQVGEVSLAGRENNLISRGDELMLVDTDLGKPVITSINLSSCESRTQDLSEALAPAPPKKNLPAPAGKSLAGMPGRMPGNDTGKALDPSKVAEQAQRMSLPGRIALPALLANSLYQERLMDEMNDNPKPKPSPTPAPKPMESLASVVLIPTHNGFVEFGERLVEARMVERSAMKDAPAKSALDGAVSVGKTTEVANEILNEMQRSRGGDKVTEDLSRYQVSIRRPGSKDGWSGEVIGPPSLFPLETVNVLTANKLIMVFDKDGKRLWESKLAYNVTRTEGELDPENAPDGLGPCVERKGILYVFDEGVLTAFDIKTGNARWRVPSVGITGLFFDDQDMVYVNTTTAGHDSLKYSRQIDISDKTSSVVLKIDTRTGKTMWSEKLYGRIGYLSGPFIYVVQSRQPEEEDPDNPPMETGLESRPFLKIQRINPKNGYPMWEYSQERAPLDVQFDRNTIRLVFRKEVQVLKYMSLK
jgi:outer membrane protein assembly factor BamB